MILAQTTWPDVLSHVATAIATGGTVFVIQWVTMRHKNKLEDKQTTVELELKKAKEEREGRIIDIGILQGIIGELRTAASTQLAEQKVEQTAMRSQIDALGGRFSDLQTQHTKCIIESGMVRADNTLMKAQIADLQKQLGIKVQPVPAADPVPIPDNLLIKRPDDGSDPGL